MYLFIDIIESYFSIN